MYPKDYGLNFDDDSVVSFFSLPYEALNNWSAHQIELWGSTFATNEHAFQYAKFRNVAPKVAEEIKTARSPWEVFQITNQHRDKSPADWKDRKIAIMTEIVEAKVTQNKDVKERLLSTGKRRIIENSPWDDFWGVGSDGKGENHLGQILMQIRDRLLTEMP